MANVTLLNQVSNPMAFWLLDRGPPDGELRLDGQCAPELSTSAEVPVLDDL
jgi:hypothetical protein